MNFLGNFKLLTAAIMGLVAVVSVCFALNGYVAKDAEVKALEAELNSELLLVGQRLDQKIIADDIRRIQQQIWDLELYYKKIGKPIPPHVEMQIKKMRDDINRLTRQLKQKG